MPTYEYECSACGHAFEEFQSMSDKPLRKCPQCKKQKLQRLIGAGAGIIFKGSGFYETDYKRQGQPKPQGETAAPAKSEPAASAPAPAPAPAKSAPADKPAKAS